MSLASDREADVGFVMEKVSEVILESVPVHEM